MAKNSAGGFTSVAAAKRGVSKKAKAKKAKKVAAAHKVSGYNEITATFVRGGAVRPK